MPGRPRRSVSSLPSSAATRDQLTTPRLSAGAGRPVRATAPRARPPRCRPRPRPAGERCPECAARRLRRPIDIVSTVGTDVGEPRVVQRPRVGVRGSRETSRARGAPNARARSDCGVSSATRRVFSRATRSARRSTSSRLCVEMSTARRSCRSRRISSRTSRALSGSSPDVGSSSSTAPGSCSSARASATRWRNPFESTAAGSAARSVTPKRSIAESTARSGRGSPCSRAWT